MTSLHTCGRLLRRVCADLHLGLRSSAFVSAPWCLLRHAIPRLGVLCPQEEILNGREMAGQGQDLMHSMRAAEAAQRAGHHLARGGGGGGSGSAAGQASGVPAPSGGSGGGGGIDMGGGPSQMGVGQGGSATLPSSAPEFGGFPSAEAT